MNPQAYTFEDIQTQIQEHYQAGDYAGALNLAQNYSAQFPDQMALFYYWRICFHARLAQHREAIQLLSKVLQDGLWYSETLLRKSPSLHDLQGNQEFEQLVERNRQVQREEQSQHYPLIILRSQGACSQGSLPCPLLIGLHSNGSIVETSLPFWRPAASAGWLVAAPRSSQAMWRDAYIWDDLETSQADITRYYQTLLKSYSIDPHRIVIAGHSMGGEVAIRLALNGALPAAGFIAVGPAGPYFDNPQQWLDLITQAASRNERVRGYLIFGEQDSTIPQAGIHTLAEMMAHAGIECQVETIPDAGHDFIPEYEPALLRGLEFIRSPQIS